MVLDGQHIAEEILTRLAEQPKPDAFFGATVVGDDSASLHFLAQKERVAKRLGVDFRLYRFPETITTDALRAELGRIARQKTCGALILQLPLPGHIQKHYALNAIPKEKDPDCLSEGALGAFYTERHAIVPPSVATLAEILSRHANDLRSKTVAVVGAGFLIGKPVGFWLQNRVAELRVFDSKALDLHSKLADADIVVSGTGKARLFGAEHLKKGALVIDFGYGKKAVRDEKGEMSEVICGDFDPQGAEEKNIIYTKTPGGTGPILVAKLFENFYKLIANNAN
jgi:methylenetetrahydrofolate dehydrogenase (NADP+)/methenyltetrahydrofolate cyclohydrolase